MSTHVPVFDGPGQHRRYPDGSVRWAVGPATCGARIGGLTIEGCGEPWPCTAVRAAGWTAPYAHTVDDDPAAAR